MKGRELASFVIQIARGMTHLESKGIIHRDLATRNVLINDRKIVKIADFGLSQTTYYEGNANAVSVRWAAPEVLKYQDFTHQSDVWSFGVTCWEIYNSGKDYGPFKSIATCKIFCRCLSSRFFFFFFEKDCPGNYFRIKTFSCTLLLKSFWSKFLLNAKTVISFLFFVLKSVIILLFFQENDLTIKCQTKPFASSWREDKI